MTPHRLARMQQVLRFWALLTCGLALSTPLSYWLAPFLPDLQISKPMTALGALIVFSGGFAILAATSPWRRGLRLATLAAWMSLLLSVMSLLTSLAATLAPRFTGALGALLGLLSAYAPWASRPLASYGLTLLSIVLLLVLARETARRDAFIHVAVIAVLSMAVLPFFALIGRSVLQGIQQQGGPNDQGVIGGILFAYGTAGLWLLRRAAAAPTRTFRLTLKFWPATLLVVTVNLTSALIYFATMDRLENIHRDYLEAVFRLQNRALSSALRASQNDADVLSNLPDLQVALGRLAELPRSATASRQDLDALARTLVHDDVVALAIAGLDGGIVARVGTAPDAVGFEHALDHEHDLFWSNGLWLRSALPVMLNGRLMGHIEVHMKLPAIERILLDTEVYGASAETLLCVPADLAHANCLPRLLQGAPLQIERVGGGRAGNAIGLAMDGKMGSVLNNDPTGRAVFSAYGAIAATQIGMVTQIPEAEILRRNLGILLGHSMLNLVMMVVLSIVLRRPLPTPAIRSTQGGV
jgi:hypothetical protein